MGSGNALLKFQFISESMLLTFISFLLAFTAIQLSIPKFNQHADININLAQYNSPLNWILILIAILVVGMIAGIFPAMTLSSFRSVANIRGESSSGFRRLMLTVQFTITIILVIGVVTNLQQLQFVLHADHGFSKDHIITINTPEYIGDEHLYRLRETFKNKLLQYPNIRSAAYSGGSLLGEPSTGARLIIGDSVQYFQWDVIEPDFLSLVEMELLEGRAFSKIIQSDNWDGNRKITLIINETAAKAYWTESPVGKIFYAPMLEDTIPCEIIGIVKDVHHLSMHRKVEPMM